MFENVYSRPPLSEERFAQTLSGIVLKPMVCRDPNVIAIKLFAQVGTNPQTNLQAGGSLLLYELLFIYIYITLYYIVLNHIIF